MENNNIGWSIQQVIDRISNCFIQVKIGYVDVQHQITNKYRSQKQIWFLVSQQPKDKTFSWYGEMFRKISCGSFSKTN